MDDESSQKEIFEDYLLRCSANSKEEIIRTRQTNKDSNFFTKLDEFYTMTDEDFIESFKDNRLNKKWISSLEEEKKIQLESFIFKNPTKCRKHKYDGFYKLTKDEPDIYIESRLKAFKKAKGRVLKMFEEYYNSRAKKSIAVIDKFVKCGFEEEMFTLYSSIDLCDIEMDEDDKFKELIKETFDSYEVNADLSDEKCLRFLEKEVLPKLCETYNVTLFLHSTNINMSLRYLIGKVELLRKQPRVKVIRRDEMFALKSIIEEAFYSYEKAIVIEIDDIFKEKIKEIFNSFEKTITIEVNSNLRDEECIRFLEEVVRPKIYNGYKIILLSHSNNIDTSLKYLSTIELFRRQPRVKVITFNVPTKIIERDLLNRMNISKHNRKLNLKNNTLIDILLNLPFNLEFDRESLNLLYKWDTFAFTKIERILINSLLDFFIDTPLSFLLDEDNVDILSGQSFYKHEEYPILGDINTVILTEESSQFLFLFCLRIYSEIKRSNIYDEFFYFKNGGKYVNTYLEFYLGSDVRKIHYLLTRLAILQDDIPVIETIIKKTKGFIKEYDCFSTDKDWNSTIDNSAVEVGKLRSSGKRKYKVTVDNSISKCETWIKNAKLNIKTFMETCLKCPISEFKKNFILKVNKNDYSPDILEENIKAIRCYDSTIHTFLQCSENMESKFFIGSLWENYFETRFNESPKTKTISVEFNRHFCEFEQLGLISRSVVTKKFKGEIAERVFWEPEPFILKKQ